jgi:alpha-galactosidase
VDRARSELAARPLMGWNSWDVYGASVTEREVLDNADYMQRHLLPHGWEYVVVDIQWSNPTATSSIYQPFAALEMDEYSRLVPAANRFPSAFGGAGFAPLAQQIHDRGLRFGIHVMRGIPRQAVHANTPISGTDVTAREIASIDSICPWNTDMYGINAAAPGALEYYDSLLALYASWGVDFLKVDDMLLPYAEAEIELLRMARDRCDRDIVLSLSPGPVDVSKAPHLRRNAQMWRITADFWDSWNDLFQMFEHCATWSGFSGPGSWPDADMLPLGRIAIRSMEHGVGERSSRFTRDEQITMMTLWCIFRSPLMLGCDLTTLDDATLDLICNDEVLSVLTNSGNGRQIFRRGPLIAWVADGDRDKTYLAIFNTGFSAIAASVPLDGVDLPEAAAVRDLWSRADLGISVRTLGVDIAAHGARLLELSTPATRPGALQ